MSLTTSEREQIKVNHFHLDLLEMVLIRHGSTGDAYRGAGFIRQSEQGRMEFRIYDPVREPGLGLPNLAPGFLIPEEEYYDLEAQDFGGRTWRASQALPQDYGSYGYAGCVCSGTVRQISCTEALSTPSSKEGLWMYLPGDFKLPTTAGTRVKTAALESRSYSFDFNLWEVKNDLYEFLFTKVDGGLEVNVWPAGDSFPAQFEMRLEEALWFTLAVPAKWNLLEEVKGGERRFAIRAPDQGAANPRVRPPLEPGHGEPARHTGEMLIRYLLYVLPYGKSNRYHPVSVAIYRNLRSSALSVDAEALWLSVSLETVAGCFKRLGRPNNNELKNIGTAIKYIEEWDGDAGMKERMVKAVKGWRGQNTRAALWQLMERGVITEQQLAAWNAIRHRMAHGHELNKPVEELLALRNLMHMALLRMLFEVVGYSGPYTDRSEQGWPTSHYDVNRVMGAGAD